MSFALLLAILFAETILDYAIYNRIAAGTSEVTDAEMSHALFEAIRLDQLAMIPRLLDRGADPNSTVRDPVTKNNVTPLVMLLRSEKAVQGLMNPAGPNQEKAVAREGFVELLSRHCILDFELAAEMRRHTNPGAAPALREVFGALAEAQWRAADGTRDTIAHRVLIACRSAVFTESETIAILEVVLDRDPAIMAVENAGKLSPTALAIKCTNCPEVIRRFTMVLFGRYQLLDEKRPRYRSNSSEVHECRDLLGPSDGPPLVLKLVTSRGRWAREIEVRAQYRRIKRMRATKAKIATKPSRVISEVASSARAPVRSAADSENAAAVVPVISAVALSDPSELELERLEGDAAALNTSVCPVTVLPYGIARKEARSEALALMRRFRFALCMPRADRNLHEIIVNERVVDSYNSFRRLTHSLAVAVADIHSCGLVHGNIEPTNVLRYGEHLALADFETAVFIGPGLKELQPNGDRVASKPEVTTSGDEPIFSTAYAAPELLAWLNSRPPAGRVWGALPTIPQFGKLSEADLWSCGVTLFEMATGHPLLLHVHGTALPRDIPRLSPWTGLKKDEAAEIEARYDVVSGAKVIDLVSWLLEPTAVERPLTVGRMLDHAVLNSRRGSLRPGFVSSSIDRLLRNSTELYRPIHGTILLCCAESDSPLVLNQLALQLAGAATQLLLDGVMTTKTRLDPDWPDRMDEAMAKADVVVVAISPAFLRSNECGHNVNVAWSSNTPVLCVLLAPIPQWPPERVGKMQTGDRLAAATLIDISTTSDVEGVVRDSLIPKIAAELVSQGVQHRALTPRSIRRPIGPAGGYSSSDTGTIEQTASTAASPIVATMLDGSVSTAELLATEQLRSADRLPLQRPKSPRASPQLIERSPNGRSTRRIAPTATKLRDGPSAEESDISD